VGAWPISPYLVPPIGLAPETSPNKSNRQLLSLLLLLLLFASICITHCSAAAAAAYQLRMPSASL